MRGQCQCETRRGTWDLQRLGNRDPVVWLVRLSRGPVLTDGESKRVCGPFQGKPNQYFDVLRSRRRAVCRAVRNSAARNSVVRSSRTNETRTAANRCGLSWDLFSGGQRARWTGQLGLAWPQKSPECIGKVTRPLHSWGIDIKVDNLKLHIQFSSSSQLNSSSLRWNGGAPGSGGARWSVHAVCKRARGWSILSYEKELELEAVFELPQPFKIFALVFTFPTVHTQVFDLRHMKLKGCVLYSMAGSVSTQIDTLRGECANP